jgi:hypothetical protein
MSMMHPEETSTKTCHGRQPCDAVPGFDRPASVFRRVGQGADLTTLLASCSVMVCVLELAPCQL